MFLLFDMLIYAWFVIGLCMFELLGSSKAMFFLDCLLVQPLQEQQLVQKRLELKNKAKPLKDQGLHVFFNPRIC